MVEELLYKGDENPIESPRSSAEVPRGSVSIVSTPLVKDPDVTSKLFTIGCGVASSLKVLRRPMINEFPVGVRINNPTSSNQPPKPEAAQQPCSHLLISLTDLDVEGVIDKRPEPASSPML